MNPFVQLILSSAASFFALALVFYPLEKAFPAKEGQKILRPEWWLDLFFMLGQYFLWSGLTLFFITLTQHWLLMVVPAGFRAAVAAQPWWLQAVEVVILSDLLVYWAHRWQHTNGFLWSFHSIHHSSEHLDWLAAHREHPLDGIYTQLALNLPAFMLGFNEQTLVGLIAFRGLWAIYIHSNVRIPLGPLKYLVGSPELHHWHHSRERYNCNYANLSPLMDLLFRTHQCPPHEPESLGIPEPMPKTYLGHMWHPFRKLVRGKRRVEAQPLRSIPGDVALTPERIGDP
jgi:sterol desaturase/sphingolipid hydroxylase (fatty acid hydroxylase superfamily)